MDCLLVYCIFCLINMPQFPKGIAVCLSDLNGNPSCEHGPTLLFQRVMKGELQQFYACAAFRNRKSCSFYMLKCDWDRKKCRNESDKYKRTKPFGNAADIRARLDEYRHSAIEDRHFCRDCGILVLSSEVSSHKFHDVAEEVTDEQLSEPTMLLKPLSDSKANAQYLFTKQTVQVVLSVINSLRYERVLCIGVPRIHEMLVKTNSLSQSLLLDIDRRLVQFYDATDCCQYNMFNHYFFSSSQPYLNFVSGCSGKKTVLIIDPPFGGMVEVLADTLRKISLEFTDKSLDNTPPFIMLFLPYFMEHKVAQFFPGVSMLHYRVTYENHSKFKSHSSVVRIFTNISLSAIVLPADEGYRYCEHCNCYVSNTNRHCMECNKCTTKAGSTYKHCMLCGKCVKPSWSHCSDCGVCESFGCHTNQLKLAACHICGDVTHKYIDCPRQCFNKITSEVTDVTEKTGHDHSFRKKLRKRKKLKSY